MLWIFNVRVKSGLFLKAGNSVTYLKFVDDEHERKGNVSSRLRASTERRQVELIGDQEFSSDVCRFSSSVRSRLDVAPSAVEIILHCQVAQFVQPMIVDVSIEMITANVTMHS